MNEMCLKILFVPILITTAMPITTRNMIASANEWVNNSRMIRNSGITTAMIQKSSPPIEELILEVRTAGPAIEIADSSASALSAPVDARAASSSKRISANA